MKKVNHASKTAFCGVVSALCLALMLMSSVVPLLTYTMPALSGVLLIIVALSLGQKASWVVYICVSILSLLFVTDKESAIMFLAFFGYYPVLKLKLDGMRSKTLRVLLKILLFNAAVIVSQLVVVYVLGIPFEILEGLGQWTIPLLLALANLLFIFYDSMLNQLRKIYCLKGHKYIERFFKL